MIAQDFKIKEVDGWECTGCHFHDKGINRCKGLDSKYSELLIHVRLYLGGCIQSDRGIIYKCRHPEHARHGSGYLEPQYCILCGEELTKIN